MYVCMYVCMYVSNVIELRKHRSSHDVLFIICMGLTKFGYAR